MPEWVVSRSRPRPTRRRSLVPVVVLAVSAVVFSSTAAYAQTDGKESGTPTAVDSRPEPRIIGGAESTANAWPSQVALLQHSVADRYEAQFCGGTVLSPSWILTAAHCVVTEQGEINSPSNIDVLAGTNDLQSGGERVRAAEIRVNNGYSDETLESDVALIRLDTPVRAPAMPIVAQGKGVAPGTDLVTTGWGNQSATGSNFSVKLREVHVPYVSDSACRRAYPSSPDAVYLDTQFCAGLVGAGGKDSCGGDSGGPISAKLSGTWTQVGIVSWGLVCADPTYPGVYTRLSAFSDGVKGQIRYGAQPDAASFIRQQYRDLFGREPISREIFLDGLTISAGSLSSYAAQLVASARYQHDAGGVARLYKAYFGRDADTGGMAYWVGRTQKRTSLNVVSSSFAASSEFKTTYGSLDDQAFVALVYQNVLEREGDAGGRAYWTSQLSSGRSSRGQVMTGFSESGEYGRKTRARTDIAITFYGLLRRVPTSDEYATWTGKANLDLVRSILGSYDYANRF